MVADGRKRKLLIHDCTLDDSKTYTCDAKQFKTSAFLNVERKSTRRKRLKLRIEIVLAIKD